MTFWGEGISQRMEAKGTLLISVQEFVLAYFGGDGFVRWLTSLPPDAAEAYRSKIPPSQWFPMNQYLAKPLRSVCEHFFDGDSRGAWECGRYSADLASNRFLRLFVRMASTHLLLKRATDILEMYYKPCRSKLTDYGSGHATLHIIEFEGINTDLEHRIGGWIERALEISSGGKAEVKISKSLAGGDKVTEYETKWGS